MAADTDPPPLPRPEPSPSDSPAERVIDTLRRVGDRAGTLATPALAFGLVAVAGIIAWSQLGATSPPPLEIALPTVDPAALVVPATPADAAPPAAVVHVAGAVKRPGVYQVGPGARVRDAVELAGGPGPDADLDRINLAAPVADGVQINVPRIGEASVEPLDPTTANGSADDGAPIDINTADAERLETLPGVGPATAASIIRHREEHGPFPSVAALDDVSGIGPARLDALRDLITVGAAP